MKNILSIIVFFISLCTYAQRPQWIEVPLEGAKDLDYCFRDYTYFKDINHSLDKFAGTWLYAQGNETFKITFIKKLNGVKRSNANQKEDILLSRYEYKQNGNVVFESYTKNISYVNWVIMPDSNKIVLIYREPSFTHCAKERLGSLTIEYSVNASGRPILTWQRTDKPINQQPIPCAGETGVDTSNFLAPANMVLVKQ